MDKYHCHHAALQPLYPFPWALAWGGSTPGFGFPATQTAATPRVMSAATAASVRRVKIRVRPDMAFRAVEERCGMLIPPAVPEIDRDRKLEL
jgi:hypothetical protein